MGRVSVFRSFTRDALLAEVRARFAAMTPDEWAAFLATLPDEGVRQQAERLRALGVQ